MKYQFDYRNLAKFHCSQVISLCYNKRCDLITDSFRHKFSTSAIIVSVIFSVNIL